MLKKCNINDGDVYINTSLTGGIPLSLCCLAATAIYSGIICFWTKYINSGKQKPP